MNMFFLPGLSDLLGDTPQINCDYDFGDVQANTTPFVYKFKRRQAESKHQMDLIPGNQWNRAVPTDSSDGSPCYATKKALTQTVLQFHRLGLFKPKITYNDTVVTDFGDDWHQELPVDATLKDENGDICMIFMFYKYPFVTEWGNQSPYKQWEAFNEMGNRMLRSKCAYCIVDDGFSTMLAGIKATTLIDQSSWDGSESPVSLIPLKYGEPVSVFFNWWMVKAIENVKKHKEIFEKHVPRDSNLFGP